MNDSSISDLSQLEEAIRFHDAKSQIELSSDTISKTPAKVNSRPVSFFKDEFNEEKSTKDMNKVSVNKLIDIYKESSPSPSKPVSRREYMSSTKENALNHSSSSSSSSMISNKRKLETKFFSKNPKSPMRDVTNEQISDESQNTSSSISNFYYKNSSMVSTQELLNSLLNDSKENQHNRSRPHNQSFVESYEHSGSLTNILEDEAGDTFNFKTPAQPQTWQVSRGKSPPVSSTSSFYSKKQIYSRIMDDYNSEQVPSTIDNFQPVQPQRALSSSSSSDSFHSFEDVDYGKMNNKTYNDISGEKLKLIDSYDSFKIDKIFPHHKDEYYDQVYCSPKTSKLLIIFSILVPPFYLLMAVGALDNKIGKLRPTYKILAGVLSVITTLLILMAIGLAFGYGLTHV